MSRIALVAGSTGMVGSALVDELLGDPHWQRVIALVRKPTGRSHARLDERVVDFDALATADVEADDVFCCLGTTIKTAGSRDAFRRVDHDYVVELAQRTHATGAQQFLLVTAIGSDARSRIFYNRVKGETDRDVRAVGFDALHIFEPSMLLGPRAESRPFEAIRRALTPALSPLIPGPLRVYRGIAGTTVAKAMRLASKNSSAGAHVYRWSEMKKLTD